MIFNVCLTSQRQVSPWGMKKEQRVMKTNLWLFSVTAACALSVMPAAQAAEWAAPASCGAEPAMPALDVSTVAKYNASVDKATEYQKAAKIYHSCVVKAASKEENAISNEARERITHVHEGSQLVQKRIAGHFAQISTVLKAGSKKFSSN